MDVIYKYATLQYTRHRRHLRWN